MSRPIFKALLVSVVFGVVLASCSNASSETTAVVTTSTPATVATTDAPVTVPSTTVPASTVPATTVPATTVPPTTVAPPTVQEIVVADGTVEGPGKIEAALGDQIEFTVTSDVADEVHVHGYDIFADVGPGEPASFSFVADIPGIFEVELESAHTLLVELVVQ